MKVVLSLLCFQSFKKSVTGIQILHCYELSIFLWCHLHCFDRHTLTLAFDRRAHDPTCVCMALVPAKCSSAKLYSARDGARSLKVYCHVTRGCSGSAYDALTALRFGFMGWGLVRKEIYAHFFLFMCQMCGGYLALVCSSSQINLEPADNHIFDVHCHCGWAGELVGFAALRHWVEAVGCVLTALVYAQPCCKHPEGRAIRCISHAHTISTSVRRLLYRSQWACGGPRRGRLLLHVGVGGGSNSVVIFRAFDLHGQKFWTDLRYERILERMTLSARNRLTGKIVELQLGGVMAHVVVRVGENLIESVITKRSADEMKLKVGDTVSAIIKSTEVMLEKD